MFVENLEEVPEQWREQFVEVEVDGKKGFQDKESNKAFNLAMAVKGEKANMATKLEEMSAKLDGFEQSKLEEIEKAKAEALEQAKKDGNIEELERLKAEQMADLKTRTAAEVRAEMEKEFQLRDITRQAEIELKDIVMALNPLDDTKDLLELAVKSRQKIDESGNKIYLNADGSASTLDKQGLIDELLESPSIKRLIKPSTTTNGGGNANGFSRGSAPSKKFGEYTGAELAVIRQSNPSEYERLKNEHYN